MNTRKYINWLMVSILALTSFTVTSCKDEPDKYEIAGGKPTVYYVRSPYLAQKDSLMTGAYMGNTVCLVGDNLRSIVKLYFNDREAVLNSSFVTDHTLIVDVPNELPAEPTDKIYMVTQDNETVTFDFSVLIPAPVVNSISNEFAKAGETVTINGDYLLNYDTYPLSITMPGGVEVTEFENISKTAVSFVIPAGADESGYIEVTSKYGTSRSKFYYKDDRNVLFDFDGRGTSLPGGNGWRAGTVRNDEHSIDGGYLYLGGATLKGGFGASWEEDAFCMNYWPGTLLSDIPTMKAMLDKYALSDLQMKFEVQIPSASPWKAHAMQIMLTTADMVNTNSYYGESTLPRALWMPWTQSGSYDTADKWVTVSVPLANFNKCNDGSGCNTALSAANIAGLTLFVWHGGIDGEDCSPEFFIDNIRIVPIE